MKARGSGKRKFKSRGQRKTQPKKARKTYSIIQNKVKSNRGRKRHSEDVQEEENSKHQKVEQVLSPVESESSEDEEEDGMKQLLSTFGSDVRKKEVAIDTSDEEDDQELTDKIDDIEDSEIEKNYKIQNELDVHESKDKEEEELDAETQKEDENVANTEDPFARHLFYDLTESLLDSIQNNPIKSDSFIEDWPVLGKLSIQIPKCNQPVTEIPKEGIQERKYYAARGSIPKRIDLSKQSLSDIFIKSQICDNLAQSEKPVFLNALQSELFSVMNNYQDLYYNRSSFDNCEDIRFVYCLHVVNHILKTRTKVLHHNARLVDKEDVPEEFRDQGLVRPKILMLVPFRDSVYKIISTIIKILIPIDKGNVINKKRFMDEFTGHELVMPKKNPKPEDYEKLFSGNSGDDFRIGISVTKKSLKLFADFYSSDIIIASPLGLRTLIGAEGEPDRDFDFLASIELLILDQTEIFLMQNWDHLLHVFNHLHLQPKDSHGTNFSRVRTWSLNGWGKYYRQTLIFSSLTLPEINSIFNKKCINYAGKVKCTNVLEFGSICQVFVQLPHVFQKFAVASVSDGIEARFKFFLDKILPLQRDSLMKQTVIYVPHYFDFVKLRNYFKREDISFVQICEYSKQGKVARARDMFFHGDAHFLLYTERYHFFNRIKLKGIRHLVFFELPTFPHFYYELCNLMQETYMNKKVGNSSNMTVTALYSKYDVNQLAAIVGTERAAKMVNSDRNVHMLLTDSKNSA